MFDPKKIQPLRNRLVVALMPEYDEFIGNILIPQVVKEASKRGTVVCAGPSASIQVGSSVCFSSFAGYEIHEGFLIIRDHEVLGEVCE